MTDEAPSGVSFAFSGKKFDICSVVVDGNMGYICHMEYNMTNTHTAGVSFADMGANAYKSDGADGSGIVVTDDGFRVYTHIRRNDAGELVVIVYVGREVWEDGEMVDIVDVRQDAIHVPESVDTSNVGA